MAEAEVQESNNPETRRQEVDKEGGAGLGGREDAKELDGQPTEYNSVAIGGANRKSINEAAYNDVGAYVDERPPVASLTASADGHAPDSRGVSAEDADTHRPVSSSSKRMDGGTTQKKKKKRGAGAGGIPPDGTPALSVEDLFVTISAVQVREHVS